jgi:hypothetical protein
MNLRRYTWRKWLHDPRYDAARWAVDPPMRRFGHLLGFAQRTVETLRQFPDEASDEWAFPVFAMTAVEILPGQDARTISDEDMSLPGQEGGAPTAVQILLAMSYDAI